MSWSLTHCAEKKTPTLVFSLSTSLVACTPVFVSNSSPKSDCPQVAICVSWSFKVRFFVVNAWEFSKWQACSETVPTNFHSDNRTPSHYLYLLHFCSGRSRYSEFPCFHTSLLLAEQPGGADVCWGRFDSCRDKKPTVVSECSLLRLVILTL